jgi:hypothetical protein
LKVEIQEDNNNQFELDMAEPKRDLKRSSVAVVGTGMAGLSAAYLLKNDPQSRFDVEVFEAVCPALLSLYLLLDVTWSYLRRYAFVH